MSDLPEQTGDQRKRLATAGSCARGMKMASDRSDQRSVLPAAKIVIFFFAAGLLVWLLAKLKMLIVILLLACTLASAIAPVAEAAERRKIPRLLAVFAVYLVAGSVYALIAMALAPIVCEQALNLWQHLPDYMSGLLDFYNRMRELAGEKAAMLNVDLADLRGVAIKLLRQTLDVTAGFFGLILNGILTLFLATYFVVEANEIWPRLLKWLPPGERSRWGALIRPLEARMGGYVRGQLLVSVAVATFIGTGLTLLGVKYGILLGILAGLMNLAPYVGSLSAAVMSVTIAFNQSILLAGLTIGLFALEQWAESTFIVPQLLGKQVDMHPMVVLLSILIGATLMGLPGALIAVPVAAAGLVIAEEFYLKRIDEPNQPGEAQ